MKISPKAVISLGDAILLTVIEWHFKEVQCQMSQSNPVTLIINGMFCLKKTLNVHESCVISEACMKIPLRW